MTYIFERDPCPFEIHRMCKNQLLPRGFRNLSYYRHAYIQTNIYTPPKLYKLTTPFRGGQKHMVNNTGRLDVITALHEMQTPSSDENSVRPSVCQTRDLWRNGKKSVQIFILYERSFSLVFREKEWLVGVTPFTWNFGSTGPHWSKIADFRPIFARSSLAITPSEKSSINTNRKSTTRFPMSLRWSSYVAPKSPKGSIKNAKRPISVKNRTSLEESLLQSFFVWKLSAA